MSRVAAIPMDHFLHLNLIRLFDFYLAAMLVVGLYRRRKVYWDTVRLIVSTFSLRKRLLGVVAENKRELLGGNVLRPVAITVALMIIQMVCSRLLFPQATLSLHDLMQEWWKLALMIVAFIPMLMVDIYFLVMIGRFDHGETSKYLDQAESWLGWKGPLVRVATLGFVNPKKMVQTEVRNSLRELAMTIGWAMRWASIQLMFRMIFGLTIWLLWAFG